MSPTMDVLQSDSDWKHAEEKSEGEFVDSYFESKTVLICNTFPFNLKDVPTSKAGS